MGINGTSEDDEIKSIATDIVDPELGKNQTSFYLNGVFENLFQTYTRISVTLKNKSIQINVITMKRLLYTSVFALLLFSFKGNDQNTNPVTISADSENVSSIPEKQVVFNGDYEDLLTLELASRITGFDPAKATKLHTMKGMMGEILRYYWENGREREKESTTPNRKGTKSTWTDLVQIKWVDAEADMDSFLEFIDLDKHPELLKIDDVGEAAYWNSKKNYLEVYYNGVSFTLQVDISNDDTLDKGKTLALAKLIIKERLK